MSTHVNLATAIALSNKHPFGCPNSLVFCQHTCNVGRLNCWLACGVKKKKAESSQFLFWKQMLMLRFLGKHTLRQRCMEGFLLGDNIWDNPLHISTCGRHVGSRTCQVENWDALQSQRISEDNHAYLLQLRKRPGLPAHVQASLARLSFTGVALFFTDWEQEPPPAKIEQLTWLRCVGIQIPSETGSPGVRGWGGGYNLK